MCDMTSFAGIQYFVYIQTNYYCILKYVKTHNSVYIYYKIRLYNSFGIHHIKQRLVTEKHKPLRQKVSRAEECEMVK